jgi:hypothetical protein
LLSEAEFSQERLRHNSAAGVWQAERIGELRVRLRAGELRAEERVELANLGDAQVRLARERLDILRRLPVDIEVIARAEDQLEGAIRNQRRIGLEVEIERIGEELSRLDQAEPLNRSVEDLEHYIELCETRARAARELVEFFREQEAPAEEMQRAERIVEEAENRAVEPRAIRLLESLRARTDRLVEGIERGELTFSAEGRIDPTNVDLLMAYELESFLNEMADLQVLLGNSAVGRDAGRQVSRELRVLRERFENASLRGGEGRRSNPQGSPVHPEQAESVRPACPPGEPRRGRREPCLLYTSPSPRDRQKSRMPSSA